MIYPIYGLIIVSVLWFWGRPVVDQDRIMVAISGLCMATSVGVDRFVSSHDANFHLIEDGAKMLGPTLWAVFLVRIAIRLVLASGPPPQHRRRPRADHPRRPRISGADQSRVNDRQLGALTCESDRKARQGDDHEPVWPAQCPVRQQSG